MIERKDKISAYVKNDKVRRRTINPKLKFSIPAALFTFYYLIYRRMYLESIGYVFFSVMLTWMTKGIDTRIEMVVDLVVMAICGFAFYPLYGVYIDRLSANMRKGYIDNSEFMNKLSQRKDTDILGLSVAIAVTIVMIVYVILVEGLR